MAVFNYEEYLVRKPVQTWLIRTIKGRQSPVMTYMSNSLVPGSNVYIEMTWVDAVPKKSPQVMEHTHEYNQVLLYIGGDAENPEDLGGEIEYDLGGQPLTFDTSAAIYVPRGVKHGKLIWKRVERPHLEMSIILGGVNAGEWVQDASVTKPPKRLAPKKDEIDYGKYLVTRPQYQEGRRTFKDGRGPVMVYMCNDHIPEVNLYIDYVWIFSVPPPHIFEHVHEKYNEFVIHAGNNPDRPKDLGAEIEYFVNGQSLIFDKTTTLYVPKALKHGPLNWKRVDRPHLQMPIIIGAGSMAQAMPGGYQVK